MLPMTPGDDPIELTPVRRLSFTAKPTTPGVKGGQDRSGAEIEYDYMPLILCLLGASCIILIALLA
jgi:hypothetical protein